MVAERIFAVGGQVGVVRDGVLIADVAVGKSGVGRQLSADDLHNVYCLVKLVTYLLLAHVLEGAG